MERKRYYDIKVKLQKQPDVKGSYKAVYCRLLVRGDNVDQAKECALGAFKDDVPELKIGLSIAKCSLMKLNGILDATNKK